MPMIRKPNIIQFRMESNAGNQRTAASTSGAARPAAFVLALSTAAPFRLVGCRATTLSHDRVVSRSACIAMLDFASGRPEN